jgi:ribose-phosphate pyrophosphokinase
MSHLEPEAKIFACSQSVYLAEKISEHYRIPLGKVTMSKYSDGEFQPSYEESIRGIRVFIVCSTFPNSDNLMELLLMIDAAKRASARHITAVIPYFGWARQDRKTSPEFR